MGRARRLHHNIDPPGRNRKGGQCGSDGGGLGRLSAARRFAAHGVVGIGLAGIAAFYVWEGLYNLRLLLPRRHLHIEIVGETAPNALEIRDIAGRNAADGALVEESYRFPVG
jgi:hypothetical protein